MYAFANYLFLCTLYSCFALHCMNLIEPYNPTCPIAQEDFNPLELYKKYESTQDPRTRVSIIRKLFKKLQYASINEYDQLKRGKSIDIALQAMYQQVRSRTIPVELRNSDRFFGFFEGKTGFTIPQKWNRSFLRQLALLNPELALHDAAIKRQYKRMQKKTKTERAKTYTQFEGFSVADEIKVTRKEGAILIETVDDTIRLSNDAFKKVTDDVKDYSQRQLHVHADISAVFLMVNSSSHGMPRTPFTLYCIDRAKGVIQWKSKLWIWVFPSFGKGNGFCDAEFVVNRDTNKVCVFIDFFSTEMHCEAFSLNDGSSCFRFSTDLWATAMTD